MHEQRGVAIGNLGLDARGDIGQWDEGCAGEMALVPLDVLAHVDHAVPGISQPLGLLDAHLAEGGWLFGRHRSWSPVGGVTCVA